jgi:hypothetical protein
MRAKLSTSESAEYPSAGKNVDAFQIPDDPVDALSSPGEMSPRSLTERSSVKHSVDRLLKIICTLVGYLDCEIDDRARIYIR